MSTHCMLSKTFNHIYEQRNLGFTAGLDHWLFYAGCQIAVSTDAGLTVYTDSGFANNSSCSNLVLLWIFKFCYNIDPLNRHATGHLSCLHVFLTCNLPSIYLVFHNTFPLFWGGRVVKNLSTKRKAIYFKLECCEIDNLLTIKIRTICI